MIRKASRKIKGYYCFHVSIYGRYIITQHLLRSINKGEGENNNLAIRDCFIYLGTFDKVQVWHCSTCPAIVWALLGGLPAATRWGEFKIENLDLSNHHFDRTLYH